MSSEIRQKELRERLTALHDMMQRQAAQQKQNAATEEGDWTSLANVTQSLARDCCGQLAALHDDVTAQAKQQDTSVPVAIDPIIPTDHITDSGPDRRPSDSSLSGVMKESHVCNTLTPCTRVIHRAKRTRPGPHPGRNQNLSNNNNDA